MKDEFITLTTVEKKLSESNTDGFEVALLFNSYFKTEMTILINGLFKSETRDEDIGKMDFLGIVIAKINQIQEKRDEG